MRIHSLTLEGFMGIRKGLGRNTLHLDLDALAGEGALVALKGANGRGKTTIMDNLHPWLLMPSRASAAGGFSYYDHVDGTRAKKTLVWSHAGKTYRSEVLVINERRRRTEAYLFEQQAQRWQPVMLADGTASDGRQDSYTRCLEGILGSEQLFLTAVFSAQHKRPLSSYRNAEIKALLSDLLGLDAIQALGQKAQETARLLKSDLQHQREQADHLQVQKERLQTRWQQCQQVAQRLEQAQRDRQQAQEALLAERTRQAQEPPPTQRAQWLAQRQAMQSMADQQLSGLKAQQQRETLRLQQMHQRQRIRQQAHEQAVAERALRIDQLQQIVQHQVLIERAVRRLPLRQAVLEGRRAQWAQFQAHKQALNGLDGQIRAAQAQLAGIEREVGQVVLRQQDLQRRSRLQHEVPCTAVVSLHSQCPLLADARTARLHQPEVGHQIEALARRKEGVLVDIGLAQAQRAPLTQAVKPGVRVQAQLRRAEAAREQDALWAARWQECERAMGELLRLREAALPSSPVEEESPGDVQAVLEDVARRIQQIEVNTREALARVDVQLAALPAPEPQAKRQARLQVLSDKVQGTEAAHLHALKKAQEAEVLAGEVARLQGQHKETLQVVERLQDALGNWLLFARCMSHDGLIALAIDEAGPVLSQLANDLLLACYGPRFTVSIRTLLETTRGDREGFEILVHDGQTGTHCPVGWMSGGERVWILESLTRGMALYLAQASGQRYATLFTDEADGALDADRKRGFMAMKREVLRLGGYAQEFFVSQTPELTAMADVVIDLDAMQWVAAIEEIEH